jgi:hypothetical protein
MVPGQRHVRMNMYIARAEGGTFKVLENLGHIDPDECEVGRLNGTPPWRRTVNRGAVALVRLP